MRNLLTVSLLLLAGSRVQAQQSVYICKGFTSKCVQLTSMDDIRFSAGQKHVYIAGTEFDLEDIDSITLEKPIFKEVKISYSASGATVDVPSFVKGVSYSVNGSNVTLTSANLTDEILYSVSGASSNGSLTINGDYKLTVALNGLDLKSASAKAPIDIECGKRVGLILQEGTVNNIEDASSNSAKGAFYTAGHLEFEGGGTLNVTGKAKHAICAKEYLQFKKTTGTVNILGAVSDGIHCGKGKVNDDNCFFQMNGGTVTVSNAGSDCIDCDDYGCAYIKGGKLVLNVSQADGSGLKADSCIYMTGGDVNVNVSGNLSEGMRCSYAAYFDGGNIDAMVAGDGSRGIRAKKTTKTTDTVLNGGYIYFGAASADIKVTGGTYRADNSVCYGIKADKEFQQTDGNITITVSSSDSSTKAYSFKSNTSTGGTLTVK